MPRDPVLLTAALAVLAAAPAGGQQPDSVQDARPPRALERPALPAVDTTRQEEAASPGHVPSRFALALTVGTHGFDRLQSQPVQAHRRNAAGAAIDSALLTRFVEAEGGYQLGVSGVLNLRQGWGARVGAGIARTTLRPAYEGEAGLFAATAERLAAGEVTGATVLALEAALRLRIPSSRRPQPYLELGASAIRWSADTSLPGAPELADGVLRLAGIAALGVEVPFSDRLAARLQGTTRAFRTPVDPARAGRQGAAGRTMTFTFKGPEADTFADGAQELVTALRLELGISLGLGGPAASPPDPVAPAESPQPSGR